MTNGWFICPVCGAAYIPVPWCQSWELYCPSCKNYRTACDDWTADNKTTMAKEANDER